MANRNGDTDLTIVKFKKTCVLSNWGRIHIMVNWLTAFIFCVCTVSAQADFASAKARIAEDVKQGNPLVAQVTVALCDNASQGIVPVGNGLCDGDVPGRNLYWGALYGVKTFFSKHKDWVQVSAIKPLDERILERVIFRRVLDYDGVSVPVYVIADAWQGKDIRSAMEQYIKTASGEYSPISLSENLQINDAAHIMAYVGHNGLMDFSLPIRQVERNYHSTSSAIILACKSDPYFAEILRQTQTHKLLTTSGFMAPEAYTLEAAITRWFSGGSPKETHLAASEAYSQYQNAQLAWSKTLFVYEQ